MSNDWSFETRQIHAGQEPDTATGARALPIYQTTSFVFPSAESAANRFALQELAPIYTRIGNPTQEAVETRIASLEGGAGALLLSSGQAASTYAILNLAQAGDHIVASPSLYGGTYNLLKNTLTKFGIKVSFVADPDDLDQWRAAVQPNTKAFFGEVVSNPRQDVLDIEGVSAVAHEAGVPLIVDNTFATPYLQQPMALGADIVVHSTTKYCGGHSDVIGGALVTSDDELAERLRFHQNAIGGVAGPFDSWLVLRGLRTLAVRMERHCDNAERIADWLVEHPRVADVYFPGLAAHPGHDLAKQQMRRYGGMISFRVHGGEPAALDVVRRTKIILLGESLGGVESLIEHPGRMTHASVAGTELQVPDDLIRLSVGIEDVEDLIADLDQALDH
jgi:cystathionine beta-lyase/cystathionine gamma-synthase